MSIDATAARKKLQGTMPAPHEQAVAIASTLSASMVLLYPEARTKGVYFELFRRMDPLRRNCIKFHEFVDMVRIGLRCSVARLDDLSLRMFWRAGDTDSKGTITLGAFVKLMSLGWRGFTDEQERLRSRPDWELSMHPLRSPGWEDLSPSLKQRAATREEERCSALATWHDEAEANSVARRSLSFEKPKQRRRRRRPERASERASERSDASEVWIG